MTAYHGYQYRWVMPALLQANAVSITGTNLIIITDDAYASVDAFLTAMSGKYLYYELATPITMTIDGNEVTERINESLGGIINSLPANIISGSSNVSGMSYSNGTITSNSTDTRAFCLRLFLGTSSNSQAVEIYGRD